MANYTLQNFEPLKGDYSKLKIAIVCAMWNADVNGLMLEHCIKTLKTYKLSDKNISVIKVPGSFEIPYAAKQIAKQKKADAVICLGTIIKGETMHDVVLAHSVTDAIMQLNLEMNIPFILGVLTCNTLKQATERANGKHGNKGADCAEAALRMWEIFN